MELIFRGIQYHPTMPLQLLPAVTRDDMREVAVIKREAYATIESNGILFPVELPDEPLVADLEKGAEEPARSCFKVVDTELEAGQQIVAFAQWCVRWRPLVQSYSTTAIPD